MSNRRRLTPQQRRDELLDVGAAIFRDTSYEDVVMADVAQRAHASRALIYHYFPTKRDLFAAIWQRAHERLIADTLVVGGRPLRDDVADALERHLSFYQDHAPLVMVANRSSIAHDPALRIPIADGMRLLCDRMLDASGATGHARDVASAALAGWIAFVREIAVEWLQAQRVSRTEVVALCMSVLDATLGAEVDLTAAPRP